MATAGTPERTRGVVFALTPSQEEAAVRHETTPRRAPRRLAPEERAALISDGAVALKSDGAVALTSDASPVAVPVMPLKPQRNMWVLLIIAAVLLLALVAGVAYWMHAYKWFKPLVPPASTPMLTAPKHVDA